MKKIVFFLLAWFVCCRAILAIIAGVGLMIVEAHNFYSGVIVLSSFFAIPVTSIITDDWD